VEYFASLRSALHLILVSKPIVSSRMCKMLSAVSKRRSGRNVGRSMNRVAPLTDCNEAATKYFRTLLLDVNKYTSVHCSTINNNF